MDLSKFVFSVGVEVEWSLEVDNWVVLSKWNLAISLSDQGQSSEIGGDFVAYDVP